LDSGARTLIFELGARSEFQHRNSEPQHRSSTTYCQLTQCHETAAHRPARSNTLHARFHHPRCTGPPATGVQSAALAPHPTPLNHNGAIPSSIHVRPARDRLRSAASLPAGVRTRIVPRGAPRRPDDVPRAGPAGRVRGRGPAAARPVAALLRAQSRRRGYAGLRSLWRRDSPHGEHGGVDEPQSQDCGGWRASASLCE